MRRPTRVSALRKILIEDAAEPNNDHADIRQSS
jgi:hypothetical protein